MIINVNALNSPYSILLKKLTQELAVQDVYVYVDSSGGPISILLPLTSNCPRNVRIFIQDTAGQAAAHNITILTSGGDTINAGPSIVINTANGFARCKIGSPGFWTSVGNSTGSANNNFTPIQTADGQQAYVGLLGFTGGTIKMLYLDGSLLGPQSAGEWSYNSGTDTLTFESITITSIMWVQGTY